MKSGFIDWILRKHKLFQALSWFVPWPCMGYERPVSHHYLHISARQKKRQRWNTVTMLTGKVNTILALYPFTVRPLLLPNSSNSGSVQPTNIASWFTGRRIRKPLGALGRATKREGQNKHLKNCTSPFARRWSRYFIFLWLELWLSNISLT